MRVSRRVSTHLPGGEDVVHVLEEGFVLDLLVREEEGDAVALLAGCPVQVLQVLQQVRHVVRPDDMATSMQYQSSYTNNYHSNNYINIIHVAQYRK